VENIARACTIEVVGNRRSLLLWLGLSGVTAGCGNLLGISDLGGPADAPSSDDATDAPLLPECKAQRLVHLVGGNGGLAWFTLALPVPSIIQSFSATFAYDDPNKATVQLNDAEHPLFARLTGGHGMWQDRGTHPLASVFVAGKNETHTNQPSTNALNNGIGLDAAATVVQASLAARFPAIVIGAVGPFGTATGAATPASVADDNGLIALLVSAGVATDAQLRPSATQLAKYVPAGAATAEINLATALATVANALRFNLVGDLVVPAFLDDPHGAFDGGSAGPRADHLAQMLDAFYADLQTANEPACGHAGQPLSFADNTVLYVTGDTPKNYLTSAGWPDNTVQNTNLVFLRTNGFIKPGWFGRLDNAGTFTPFDVTTGALIPNTPDPGDTPATWASTLYAVTRGNSTEVSAFSSAMFDGEKLQ
jgi:hypothetical protein